MSWFPVATLANLMTKHNIHSFSVGQTLDRTWLSYFSTLGSIGLRSRGVFLEALENLLPSSVRLWAEFHSCENRNEAPVTPVLSQGAALTFVRRLTSRTLAPVMACWVCLMLWTSPLPYSSTFKGSGDDTGSTLIIQGDLPILRSAD